MGRVVATIAVMTLLIIGYLILDKGSLSDDHSVTSSSVYEPMNGDLIFHVSRSSQSEAIQLATKSKYSHMGIVYTSDDGHYVFEAVQPVKRTKLDEWISRGEGGHYVAKRLRNADDVLTVETLQDMKRIGEQYLGLNYDSYFEWSDERIYCSELVWKIYEQGAGVEIGKLQKLSEFDLMSDAVKRKLTERYGDNVPLGELVISPAAMFDSELLVTVYEN